MARLRKGMSEPKRATKWCAYQKHVASTTRMGDGPIGTLANVRPLCLNIKAVLVSGTRA